jgi:hypothetical protein
MLIFFYFNIIVFFFSFFIPTLYKISFYFILYLLFIAKIVYSYCIYGFRPWFYFYFERFELFLIFSFAMECSIRRVNN